MRELSLSDLRRKPRELPAAGVLQARRKGGTKMEQKKIDRINELARKAKQGALTQEEVQERDALRAEYVKAFRESLRSQLDGITVVRPDGTKHPLKRK